MPHCRRALVAPLIALALAGCSGQAPAPAAPAAPAASEPAAQGPSQSAVAPTSAASVEPSSAAQAGVDPANRPKAIVPGVAIEATTWNEKQEARVTVELVRLERRDKLVVAVFAVTPESTSTTRESLYSWLGGTHVDPQLVDPTGLKAYSVVQADNQRVMGDPTSISLSAGQTAYQYAVLAAPPAEVKEVDVIFASSVRPFEKVPLS